MPVSSTLPFPKIALVFGITGTPIYSTRNKICEVESFTLACLVLKDQSLELNDAFVCVLRRSIHKEIYISIDLHRI